MIPAAKARSYVEIHTDADRSSIKMMGSPQSSKPRKHWTFRYRERTSGTEKVAHLITRADVVDDRLFESEAEELRNLPGAAPQVVIQAAGDVVLIVRDYVELLSGVPAADQIQFGVARDYLVQILRTLAKWHKRGVFHGDLRPENVAVKGRRIEFVDFFARLPLDEMGSGRLDYVAPELRDGARRGSTAGDVYSFARLAVELLRPFRGDLRDPSAALLERQLAWLSDYCYIVEPHERPTARAVLTYYFETIADSVGDAPNVESSFVPATEGSSGAPAPDSSSVDSLESRFRSHTEFRLTSRTELLLDRLKRSISMDDFARHPRLPTGDIGRLSFVEKSGLRDNIDSRWRTSVHRLHFGHGFDRDHDVRTNRRPVDPAFVARDAFYAWHLEASRDVRNQLIAENDFLFTSQVVELLSRRIDDVQSADVNVLRHLGAILAVPDHDRWLYPAFQFNQAGEIDPSIQLVNDLLRHSNGLPEDEWSTFALWCLPQSTLNGRSLQGALRQSTFDEVASMLRPEFLDEPPFWFNAPQEIRTMAVVENAMRKDAQGTLQGESGEEILWDKTGSDLVLRWSAESNLDQTLALFSEFIAARPDHSLGAYRRRSGPLAVLPSTEVLTPAGGYVDLDLLRLDLDRFAFVWEAVLNRGEELPVADITAIFHPSQADKVEVMVRRTGTRTVRECAKVAIQSVVLRGQLS